MRQSSVQLGYKLRKTFFEQCRFNLQSENILKDLESENFDVAITEIVDLCGLGERKRKL